MDADAFVSGRSVPNVGGRPSEFTMEQAKHICDLVADGMSINQIAKEIGCARRSIYYWLDDNPEFAAKYERACNFRAQCLADDAQDIASAWQHDWKVDSSSDDGVPVPKFFKENYLERKLHIDWIKFRIVSCAPKKAVANGDDARVIDGETLEAHPLDGRVLEWERAAMKRRNAASGS